MFGRGGEEAIALFIAGIAYETVPGVSVIAAVPGSAGVPLTMRGMSSSVAIITGHDPFAEGDGASVHWDELARSGATLVVLVGANHLAAIASRVLGTGKDPTTRVLVVERGTMPDQRSVRTTLAHLGTINARAGNDRHRRCRGPKLGLYRRPPTARLAGRCDEGRGPSRRPSVLVGSSRRAARLIADDRD